MDEIKIPSYGAGQMKVENLTPEELEKLMGALLGGHHWVRRDDQGRLEFVPSYKPLPDPVQDEDLYPHWHLPTEEERIAALTKQLDLIKFESIEHHSPSIYIMHLCGYNWSPENYKRQAEKLTSWGFAVMRSQRNSGGIYHEAWYLPGIFAAKGDFEKTIKASDRKDADARFHFAINFLCANVQFGTLDVVCQRAAMVID